MQSFLDTFLDTHFCFLDTPFCFLYFLDTLLRLRRRRCEDLAREWGHSVIFLHVERANAEALAFYSRCGFAPTLLDVSWYAN